MGVSELDLSALYLLDSLKGFGPQKFKELHTLGVKPAVFLRDGQVLPLRGKTGQKLQEQLSSLPPKALQDCRERARRQISAAHKHGAFILTYNHRSYPRNLFESNYPVPVLYARGVLDVGLDRRAVACVGSRKIRPPYVDLHERFARAAYDRGFAVVSGFALGADSLGHRAALEAGGKTICVMPGGLDRPFPPENRQLWDELLAKKQGLFVSEFAFGTRASALTLRKRNKGIVALALGVLVSQSSSDGGAMNAYRFALEQKKPVATFQGDGQVDTSGNQQIGADQKSQGPIFPLHPSEGAYGEWLQKLSSSI